MAWGLFEKGKDFSPRGLVVKANAVYSPIKIPNHFM